MVQNPREWISNYATYDINIYNNATFWDNYFGWKFREYLFGTVNNTANYFSRWLGAWVNETFLEYLREGYNDYLVWNDLKPMGNKYCHISTTDTTNGDFIPSYNLATAWESLFARGDYRSCCITNWADIVGRIKFETDQDCADFFSHEFNCNPWNWPYGLAFKSQWCWNNTLGEDVLCEFEPGNEPKSCFAHY